MSRFIFYMGSLERCCKEDLVYNGIHIKKDIVVSVSTHSLHYSEQYYTDPETFNPDRYFKMKSFKQLTCSIGQSLIGGIQKTKPIWIHMLSCRLERVLVVALPNVLH